jgi:membrane protease subunit HflC
VITQFGKPVAFVTEPGLKFRIPFIQSVHKLEKRLLPWDGEPENMQTRDKKRIFVDCWARWRITDLETFFTNVRTEQRGQKFLDDTVDSAVRDVIARNNLIDLVRTSNDKLEYETDELERTATARDVVSTGREELEKEIQRVASVDLETRYGIELVAVHIKRVKYNDRVRDTVYERMRSERQRVAQLFESEAQEEGNRIVGLTRKDLDSIEGAMKQKSSEIMGLADAEVIRMTAEAYSESPEFFQFMQQLEMYKAALGKDTNLILSTNSDMFRLLKTSRTRAEDEAATRAVEAAAEKRSAEAEPESKE